MANVNIREIINSKNNMDLARRESRKQERENLSAMRDASLVDITSGPEKYQAYLTMQADNMNCSAGNIALTMAQRPGATKVGTTDFWHKQGRSVTDDQMRNGITVFVPPRNENVRGYFMGSYYDVSQTAGRPLKDKVPMVDGTPRMEATMTALISSSPVGLVVSDQLETPARYDEESFLIIVNPNHTDTQLFAALATEIGHARIHNQGRNRGYDRADSQTEAESIGYMVCRRFGVDAPLPEAQDIAYNFGNCETYEIGNSLDRARQTARDMGDNVERRIQSRQQEQPDRTQDVPEQRQQPKRTTPQRTRK